jgi:lipopolysaccharide biosynthesis protein
MNAALFSSFSTKPFIENYIFFYLKELARHYDSVFLITNKRHLPDRQLKSLDYIGITLVTVKNEGFDFGMWYKQLKVMNISVFDEICLANDSCILFRELDDIVSWARRYNSGFFGISKSREISEHLQSFFIIVRGKRPLEIMTRNFNKNGFIVSNDIQSIVEKYEIGLSKAMKNEGIALRSFIAIQMCDRLRYIYKIIINTGLSKDLRSYKNDFISIFRIITCIMNPAIYYAKELVIKGSPMIKKKLILHTFRDFEEAALDSINFNYNEDYACWLNDWLKNQKFGQRVVISTDKEIFVEKYNLDE